ncbi:MAG: hypothetical protein JO126_06710 [Alphaproteobacteria bacterium]|nr:hypothetical protein [Alphaproteobacteria bacterium]
MQIVYQNFDGLEIAFKGAVAYRIRWALARAKQQAIKMLSPVYCELGPKKLPVMVHEAGARGGYTYQFSTGLDGEIWLVAEKGNPDRWNIRVKVRSLCLALNGYEKTKEKIFKTLAYDLLVKGPKDNEFKPLGHISRADYCVDFLMTEEFIPNYANFVCCGTTQKKQIGDIACHEGSRGRNIETLTVGKMPNRQICLYNKTREIKARSKSYWFKLWGLNEPDITGPIWRVEIRAGKKELKKWPLRTFSDFEKKIGDVILDILNSYKYTTPNFSDTNQSRWPLAEIWEKTIQAVEGNLLNYISKAPRGEIMQEIAELALDRYYKHICGLAVSYTAASGKKISDMSKIMEFISAQIAEDIQNNPEKFGQKYEKAQFKYKK